jgi:hypothetical protein
VDLSEAGENKISAETSNLARKGYRAVPTDECSVSRYDVQRPTPRARQHIVGE